MPYTAATPATEDDEASTRRRVLSGDETVYGACQSLCFYLFAFSDFRHLGRLSAFFYDHFYTHLCMRLIVSLYSQFKSWYSQGCFFTLSHSAFSKLHFKLSVPDSLEVVSLTGIIYFSIGSNFKWISVS